MALPEPLTSEENNRLTILPIKYMDIWEAYKTHESAIWHAHEIDLQTDLKDWATLSADEKHFVKYVLAFFASSDMIVAENLATRFMKEIKILEARVFYSFQNMIENIHSEVYSNMIEAYVSDQAEKMLLFNAVTTVPSVAKKATWAKKWIDSTSATLAERLVAFAIVEGVFFSGAFCCIYWLRERGKMPSLCKANDFIARDEGLHTDFACLLYKKYIVNKLSQQRIVEIINEAVEIECEFITESLPCRLLGINSNLMKIYIKYVADRLLSQLGHSKIYNTKQPFDFMNRICLMGKTNFFEETPTDYKKGESPKSGGDISPVDDFFKTL
jgi:ribonucleotide reductase beta subunit family protein with ferritin-like domain